MFDYDVIITFAHMSFFCAREYCEVGFTTHHDGELYEVLFNVYYFFSYIYNAYCLIAASVRNAALAFHC